HDLEETMSALARSFVKDMHRTLGWAAPFRAPGNATLKYCKILGEKIQQLHITKPQWWAVSPVGVGGCGSVMHAHPFGLVFADQPEKAAQWAAEHSKLTHGDPLALASCAAMAIGVAYNIQQKNPDEVITSMIETAQN